jgi:hypothetical protein
MRTEEICNTNQWIASLLHMAVKEHAIAEQAVEYSRGNVENLDTYMANIEMKWLDAALPAGNA